MYLSILPLTSPGLSCPVPLRMQKSMGQISSFNFQPSFRSAFCIPSSACTRHLVSSLISCSSFEIASLQRGVGVIVLPIVFPTLLTSTLVWTPDQGTLVPLRHVLLCGPFM